MVETVVEQTGDRAVSKEKAFVLPLGKVGIADIA